jgi:hypothetical protein
MDKLGRGVLYAVRAASAWYNNRTVASGVLYAVRPEVLYTG